MSESPHERVKVKYSDYYVAFLDVLGFSDLVGKSKDTKSLDSISDYYTQAKRAFDTLDKISSKKEIFRAAISDSIILAIPAGAGGRSPIENLRELSAAVYRIQWRMALHNIWLRGAITRGECWVDTEKLQVVGPAFIKAYHLEKAARFPRVIVDPSIIPTLEISSRSQVADAINEHDEKSRDYAVKYIFDWGRMNMAQSNSFTDDTALFVDYLSPILENGNQDSATIIYDHIEKSLFRHDTYEKFVWLKSYFKILVYSQTGGNNPHLNKLEQLIYDKP